MKKNENMIIEAVCEGMLADEMYDERERLIQKYMGPLDEEEMDQVPDELVQDFIELEQEEGEEEFDDEIDDDYWL